MTTSDRSTVPPDIRRATSADVAGICAVCAAGWRDTYTGLLPAAHIEEVIRRCYHAERVTTELASRADWNGWYVADSAGRILGAAGGGPTAPAASELRVLYVDPRWRYRGIGSALLRAVTYEMVAQGSREQFVAVHPANGSALAFYRAHGFSEFARHEESAKSPDSLRLRRPLPPEDEA